MSIQKQKMNFVYMDEDSIAPQLKCKICSRPFVDPVITPDNDAFCRSCVTLTNIPELDQRSSFLEKLVPIDERILLKMLDNLLVRCPDCNQINILRENFPEHLLGECPKRIVLCQASDLKCPWSGHYDQSIEHIKQCTFELLRPILSENVQYKKQIDKYEKYFNDQQNEITQLKTQINQYENRIEDLQNKLEEYRSNENDLQQLKEQFNQISTQSQQTNPDQPEIDEIKKRLNEYEIELKKLQEEETNSNIQIKQIQKQDISRNKDISLNRRLCEQHGIQISLLARKKSVIPKSYYTIDGKIEELIESYPLHSDIDLDDKNLDNQDMELICKRAIVDKQCLKLRLENNNLNAKSATILADTLYGNTTLTDLCLSNNSISDLGTHALAQVLSINIQTLSWLELHSNKITDEGVEYLSDMLKVNKSLISLGLSFNQITDHGVRRLTSSITCLNKTLQWLHLGWNKGITDASLENLSYMLMNNQSLQTLWLNNCSLSIDGGKQLKEIAEKNKNFILDV